MNLKNEKLMMSKEEARNRAKELLNENQVDLITKYMFLEQQCKKQKEVIDKAIEYITSYESISTIQGLTYIEANKQLDEKTMTEMTNRYLLVHDKLLEILQDKEVSK